MSNKAIELAREWDLAADDTPTECAPQFIEQCRDTSAELRRLHAEVEGLRKDAARYRWLRDEHNSSGDVAVKKYRGNYEWVRIECEVGTDIDNLDTAIDSAMQN